MAGTGRVKGLAPTGDPQIDLLQRKLRNQGQSRFHEVKQGSPSGTAAGFAGQVEVDDVNKRLLVRLSDKWYYVNLTALP